MGRRRGLVVRRWGRRGAVRAGRLRQGSISSRGLLAGRRELGRGRRPVRLLGQSVLVVALPVSIVARRGLGLLSALSVEREAVHRQRLARRLGRELLLLLVRLLMGRR